VFFLFPILGFWVGGWVVFFVFNFGFLGGKGVGGGRGTFALSSLSLRLFWFRCKMVCCSNCALKALCRSVATQAPTAKLKHAKQA